MGMGIFDLVIGVLLFFFGLNPQSPIPNPQSPIPNPQSPFKKIKYIELKYIF